MNSKTFIITELDLLVKLFPQTRVRYEYDNDALVHVVEILPKDLYQFDEEYIAWENDMFDRFIATFPLENVCFVSEDSLVGIKNPIYTCQGVDFETYSSPKASFSSAVADKQISLCVPMC